MIPADLPVQRTEHQPIDVDQRHDEIPHRAPARSDCRHRSRSAVSSGKLADAASGRARTTTLPPGKNGTRLAVPARRRRFTRFRTTAMPTALLTTNPTRDGGGVPSNTADTSSKGVERRRPERTVVANSSAVRRRSSRGSTKGMLSSGCEPTAALAPTAGEDGPARPRAHPQTEAMCLAAAPVVRLECTLCHELAPTGQILRQPLHQNAGFQLVLTTSRQVDGSSAAGPVKSDLCRSGSRPVHVTRRAEEGQTWSRVDDAGRK